MKVLHQHVVRCTYQGQEVIGQVSAQVLDQLEIKVMNPDTFSVDVIKQVPVTAVQEVAEGKIMSTADFVDKISNRYGYDNLIQELALTRENNRSDRLFAFTIHEATKQGVFLSDLEEYDYDREFHNMVTNFRL